MNIISISRVIAQNILINKHAIKALPIIDSRNERHIEEIAGNELKALKRYPVTYDLIVNIINAMHKTGQIEKYIQPAGRDYYSMTISEKTWRKYFYNCGNNSIRQSLARQVLHELQTGFIILCGKDKKRGHYIESRKPFMITAIRQYENGEKERDLHFSKLIFQSLVTGSCFKNGGEGFIEIPAELYPRLTNVNTGEIQSFNPIYKINIYGLLKNTHSRKSITVNKESFIENIIPEYASRIKGSSEFKLKMSEAAIHKSLITSIKKSNEVFQNERVISNFYIGNKEVSLHFTL